jgi:hypothetical protein
MGYFTVLGVQIGVHLVVQTPYSRFGFFFAQKEDLFVMFTPQVITQL